MAAVYEKRIPVAEGVSLHAVVWDGGFSDGARTRSTSGPSYLLVHGLSSNGRTWERVAERLYAAGRTVASVDLRGHGRSDKPGTGYDFGTLTHDIVIAMSALELDRPVVAGQSTGGNLAVELASRASDHVSGVVGVDGGVLELHDQWPVWEDCEVALAPPPFAGTPVERFESMIRQHHPEWDDWGVAATLANCEVLDDGTVRPWLSREHHLEILRALWEQRPSALIPELDVPLLLVLAESTDSWMESKRAGAALALAANELVRVEWLAGDHDLHVHHPDAVADLILGFHG